MKRRSVLAGIGAVTGGGFVVGSGAFSSVEADRNADVVVESEDDAYLQFEESNGPNNVYFDNTADNKLRLDFNDVTDTDGGFGPNRDSDYEFHDIFVVRNDGSQDVVFWLEDFVNDDGDSLVDEFELYFGDDPDKVIDGEDGAVKLPLGEEVLIGAAIETKDETGDEPQDDTNTATVIADSDPPDGVEVFNDDDEGDFSP